jgi:predicted transcriptional regulator
MKEYVAELTAKKLIEEQPLKRGKNFTITEKGRKFSREYKKMKEFQEAFGL